MTRGWAVPLVVMLGAASAGAVRAHGGIGIPSLSIDQPGRGQIVDAVDGGAEIHWQDVDPDDDANMILEVTAVQDRPDLGTALVSGLTEDCDPGDGGPVYTGVHDAGPDGSVDTAALNRARCGTHSGCVASNDCFRWSTATVPTGNYFVHGTIDDDRGDGQGGDRAFATGRGLIRVTQPGDNVPPALVFLEPDGTGDVVNTCFRVRWVDSDPDDTATVRIFASRVGAVAPALVGQLPERDGENGVDLDLSSEPDFSYYQVYAEIDDGHREPFSIRAPGLISRYTPGALDGGCLPVLADAGPTATDSGAAATDAASRDAHVPDAAQERMDASTGDASGADGGTAPPTGCACKASPDARASLVFFMLMMAGLRRSRKMYLGC